MATKEEISATLLRVDERLDSLQLPILASPDAPLLEGTWTVQDAVCHLLADADPLTMMSEALERANKGLPRPSVTNEDGLAPFKALPLADVIQEILGKHGQLIERLQTLSSDFLDASLPGRGGRTMQVSDMVLFYCGAHNQSHLDDIEKALENSTARS